MSSAVLQGEDVRPAAMTSDISGRPYILDRWRTWQGGIDCGLSGRVLPADELRRLSSAIAERPAFRNLRRGEAVAVMLANSAAFPVVLMALLEIGCNPLLTFAGTPLPELRNIGRRFGVRYAVHDFVGGVTMLPADQLRSADKVAVGGVSLVLLELDTIAEDPIEIPGSGVILHPTSGTGGAAKYSVRNQQAAMAEAENYASAVDVYREARVTITTPLTHAFAYGFGLMTAMLTDSTLAVDAFFNPKRLVRLERERPSDILAIVPPMARTFIELVRREPAAAMAKTVFYAGAPLNEKIAVEFEAVCKTRLSTILGTTETGAISTSYANEAVRAGVGRPLAGVAIGLGDIQAFRPFGEQVGILQVRSTSMMQGYVPGLDPSRPIDVFPTGDLAWIDDDDCIHIVGRARDVINLGGMKVDPTEVEAIMLTDPTIKDAVVYPGMLEDGTEFVQAAVSGEGVDTGQLRMLCLRELAAYKVPTTIHVVDQIPRSPSGKCLKFKCPEYPSSLVAGLAGG
jgi:acyl-coenzyme A synthetase/AMP-(fatty) acid ligase